MRPKTLNFVHDSKVSVEYRKWNKRIRHYLYFKDGVLTLSEAGEAKVKELKISARR